MVRSLSTVLARTRRLVLVTVTALVPTSALAQSPPYITQWGADGPSTWDDYPIRAIATGPGDVVYVADNAHRYQKFTSTGTFIMSKSLAEPASGVAVDASGNIYVADYSRVRKLSSTGSFLAQWGSYGTGPGQFEGDFHVAVDDSGNVYTAELNRVQKFTSSGIFITQWAYADSPEVNYWPFSIAVDNSGYVYVARNSHVEKFTRTGQYISQWGTRGTGLGQFGASIGGVAAD